MSMTVTKDRGKVLTEYERSILEAQLYNKQAWGVAQHFEMQIIIERK